MKQYLLFDLDGTLTDPKVGITTCVQYALESMGIHEPDLDKLEPFIGPPLKDSFMQFYNLDEEQAEAAVAKYRERFKDVGLFENEIYKGIPKMLRILKSKGLHLAVASSKPTVFVERILQHFHIEGYFEVVVGSELDGTRVNKDEVILEALRRLFKGRNVDKDRIYMIGDRKFDAEGARKMGIESIGVTYGYGDMEELMEAHADYIVRSVKELQEFLLREQEYDKPRMAPTQRVWQMVYAFVLFLVVRTTAMYVLTLILQMVSSGLSDGILNWMYIKNSAGEVEAFSKDVQMIVTAFGYLAGTAVILPTAHMMITRTAKDAFLSHLRWEPLGNYAALLAAALGLQMGVTGVMNLLQLTRTESYQAVAQAQFGGSLLLGLLCYGIVTPLAEEVLFRGILYNALKRFVDIRLAWILSAFLFGAYHGNTVQGIYGFIMGLIFAYGYEYFGSFRVPVILHMLVNIVAYLISALGENGRFLVSWPVGLTFLIIGVIPLLYMKKQKNVMK